MTELPALNVSRFFCPAGICAASDCRCPKLEIKPVRPSVREWWADSEHRKDTLSFAGIVLMLLLVLTFGPMIAQR
jgi:hypothetical protein